MKRLLMAALSNRTRRLRFAASTLGMVLSSCAPAAYMPEPTLAHESARGPCNPPTPVMQRRIELASTAVEIAVGRNDPFWTAAKEFVTDPTDKPLGLRSCLPESLLADASAKAVALGEFDATHLWVEGLRFAHAVGPRDPKIVDAVARTAFADKAIPQAPIFSDLRPEARSTLASFGPRDAAPWVEAARASMNANDSLGTSSAQVVAASQNPAAVVEVAALLRGALDGAGAEVEGSEPERLSELAFALELAGSAAEAHIPLLQDMSRKDMVVGAGCCTVGTQKMVIACRVISAIGGDAAERALGQPPCSTGNWR